MAALDATPRSLPARVRRPPWGEWLTGYVFVLPATLVIGVFGLFPIVYALYMSVHRWRIRQGAYLGLDQYQRTVGDFGAFGVFLGGIALIGVAHWLWTDAFKGRAVAPMVVRVVAATTLLFAGIAFSLGWQRMFEAGDARFLMGLTRTFYYGFLSVPVQIVLALIIASLLFQRLGATSSTGCSSSSPTSPPRSRAPRSSAHLQPARGAAGEHRARLARHRPAALAVRDPPVGQLLFGDFLARFGVELTGFWAGPSLALFTIILFGIWTYTGYNAVIFLAGWATSPRSCTTPPRSTAPTGRSASSDHRAAAGAGHLLPDRARLHRHLPGVHASLRDARGGARGSVDTASLVIFDTFYQRSEFGVAAAQSVVLFVIILAMTLLQNRLFGRRALRG
jgi:multiple sugar transport system permease protein